MSYAQPDTPEPHQIDPQQDVANEPFIDQPLDAPARQPDVQHSVWDEPGLAQELTGAPSADQVTYSRWLAEGRARWTPGKSWALTMLLALLAGPWAIVGAFWHAGESIFGSLMIVVIGPVIEEMMKIAAPLLVVERAPYALRRGAQIILCAACGGLAFAAIENLLYIYVYVSNPSAGFITWRWTVCVALHTVCSLIAGAGVLRVWRDIHTRQRPPRLTLAFPLLMGAIILHGIYNGSVLLAESLGWSFQ